MTKCYKCNKKTIVIVTCNCNKNFCLKCKYPEDHNCSFDFKTKGKKNISVNNPKVFNEKIIKI